MSRSFFRPLGSDLPRLESPEDAQRLIDELFREAGGRPKPPGRPATAIPLRGPQEFHVEAPFRRLVHSEMRRRKLTIVRLSEASGIGAWRLVRILFGGAGIGLEEAAMILDALGLDIAGIVLEGCE